MSRMVWAEDLSWDSSLCSRTFSGSLTAGCVLTSACCWGEGGGGGAVLWRPCCSCSGSAWLSACLARLPRLLLFPLLAFLSTLSLATIAGFSTLMDRGALE